MGESSNYLSAIESSVNQEPTLFLPQFRKLLRCPTWPHQPLSLFHIPSLYHLPSQYQICRLNHSRLQRTQLRQQPPKPPLPPCLLAWQCPMRSK